MSATAAYIDGLNLYYGALRNRPSLKWLNPQAMLERLLPSQRISLIRYFSAPVMRRSDDPDAPARQAIYFRALASVPNLVVHEGRMAVRTKRGVILPESSPPQTATIAVFEEKRTDVNIASHLLVDAYENSYNTAVVVSNDSDLTTCDVAIAVAGPNAAVVVSNDSDLTTLIEIVVGRLAKEVIVVNPYPAQRQSRELIAVASTTLRTINPTVLRDSQFPARITDAAGSFTRPRPWR